MLGACGFGLWHADAINTRRGWDPRVHFRTHSVGWCKDDDALRGAETVVVVAISNFLRFGLGCCLLICWLHISLVQVELGTFSLFVSVCARAYVLDISCIPAV